MSSRNAALAPEFIARQRERLEALREQLRGADRTAAAQARSFREEHGDEAREFEDEAQDMAQREVYEARHNVDERRLGDIERALQKISDGTYGISDASGKPIPKARLEANPESVLTVEEERGRESK